MPVTPIHFGEQERRLYGVFHAAERRDGNAPGVLLLNPFGEEAIRAWRACRVLAERLAAGGAPVLRFDYYGSGDSGGNDEDVDLAGMVRDTQTAHDELDAVCNKRRYVWIGVGLGGAISLLASQDGIKGLRHQILWDPVLNGKEYLRSLAQSHAIFVSGERRTNPPATELPSEALGFAISAKLREQLLSLVPPDQLSADLRKLDIISIQSDSIKVALKRAVTASSINISEYNNITESWNSDAALNAYYVPSGIIKYIADRVGSA